MGSPSSSFCLFGEGFLSPTTLNFVAGQQLDAILHKRKKL